MASLCATISALIRARAQNIPTYTHTFISRPFLALLLLCHLYRCTFKCLAILLEQRLGSSENESGAVSVSRQFKSSEFCNRRRKSNGRPFNRASVQGNRTCTKSGPELKRMYLGNQDPQFAKGTLAYVDVRSKVTWSLSFVVLLVADPTAHETGTVIRGFLICSLKECTKDMNKH